MRDGAEVEVKVEAEKLIGWKVARLTFNPW